jgi:monoamine oxidase
MGADDSVDVVVIGAGAAGLAAAAALVPSRQSVLVLEARDRVGGRIWTRTEPGIPLPIELGAEFVHGEPEATLRLMRRLGVPAVDAQGPHWTLARGRLRERQGTYRTVREALLRSRARLRARDLSFEAYLAGIGARRMPRAARSLALALVEGFDAADPARVSARSVIAEWADGGALEAPQFRPLGGYGALLAPLVSSLEQGDVQLRLNAVVRSIRWQSGEVEVEGTRLGEAFRIRARRALVTLPLGVLQQPDGTAGAVRFEPPLRDKARAIRLLASGPVLKVILRFRDAFWEQAAEGVGREAAFFHAPRAPFPTFWTALPIRVPLLVGWAGGPSAARLAGAGADRIAQAALASLRLLFGRHMRPGLRPESVTVHDWQSDPYARGAYSYLLAGGGNARKVLARPLGRTLYFAGEAADTQGEAATVAGALQTGGAAAGLIAGVTSEGSR